MYPQSPVVVANTQEEKDSFVSGKRELLSNISDHQLVELVHLNENDNNRKLVADKLSK